MRPWPLKKRETSWPRSANCAIASAETGLADLRVFFIQSDLLLRRPPQGDEVQNLALFVFPDFEDHRIQPVTHPADGQKLFRNVGSPFPISVRSRRQRVQHRRAVMQNAR